MPTSGVWWRAVLGRLYHPQRKFPKVTNPLTTVPFLQWKRTSSLAVYKILQWHGKPFVRLTNETEMICLSSKVFKSVRDAWMILSIRVAGCCGRFPVKLTLYKFNHLIYVTHGLSNSKIALYSAPMVREMSHTFTAGRSKAWVGERTIKRLRQDHASVFLYWLD